MWTVILIFPSVLGDSVILQNNAEIVCPVYSCVNQVSDTCLNVSQKSAVYSICPESYICPDFPILSHQSVQCINGIEESVLNYDCPIYIGGGLECNYFDSCKAKFYCRVDNTGFKGICTEKKLLKQKCNQVRECEDNAICNYGVCIPLFSVLPQQHAEHPLACKSGILKDEICQDYSKTKGVPGKACKTDAECTATDGAEGICACAPNSSNHGYCRYNISDEPVLRALAMQYNGYPISAKLMMHEVNSYPEVMYTDKCMENDVIEVKTKKVLENLMKKCAGTGIGLILLTLSLILI